MSGPVMPLAWVIMRRKGSMQILVELEESSAMALTTSS
jgi:hypothetical protein